MPPLSEREIQRNMQDAAHAIAQQELAGLKVPQETIADLESVARGEIDTAEARHRHVQRLRKSGYIPTDDEPGIELSRLHRSHARHKGAPPD